MSASEEDDEEHGGPVVIDNGSYNIKAGIAGHDAPKAVFRTAVPAADGNIPTNPDTSSPPMKQGFINDWSKMEKIWRHTFYKELKIVPEEQEILMTECMSNRKSDREKLTKCMFETFNVPAMYLSIDAILAMYATGRTTGMMVDCGFESVRTVFAYEGYALPQTSQKTTYGGQDCSAYLQRLLNSKLEMSEIDKIKEKCCSVAMDYDDEINKKYCDDPQYIISGYLRQIDSKHYSRFNSINIENLCMKYSKHFIEEMDFLSTMKLYELPDGRLLKIGSEAIQCTEMFFKPELVGLPSEDGIHRQIYNCAMSCDLDLRVYYWSNILLCGGSSMPPQMRDRIEKEVAYLAPARFKVRVIASEERKYLTWIGGSIMGSLSTFASMWISKDEYEESGPGIVHRKCF